MLRKIIPIGYVDHLEHLCEAKQVYVYLFAVKAFYHEKHDIELKNSQHSPNNSLGLAADLLYLSHDAIRLN